VDAKTGKPRDLQVDQALACIALDQGAILPVKPVLESTQPLRQERYFDNRHFRLWRKAGAAPFMVGAQGQPRVLVCVEGEGRIDHAGGHYAMARGAVILLPASVGACRFEPDGAVALLEIALPEHP
jgi:mannose-6-phosphate isomerase